MTKTNDGKASWHFEKDTRAEYEESYFLTTAHAVITCKCGKQVWYGCGVNQKTRPVYCKECTKLELHKIKSHHHVQSVDGVEDTKIIMQHFRRIIPDDSKKKESIN